MYLTKPLFASNPFIIEPPVITHPAGIDRIIFPRLVSVNVFLARANHDIAARGAARADAFGFLKEPNPHLESKIFGRERADRTDIDRVQRVIVIERLARIGGAAVVTAPIDNAARIIPDDIFCKADATSAKDAALVIQHDART